MVRPQPLHTSSPTLCEHKPTHGLESGLLGLMTLMWGYSLAIVEGRGFRSLAMNFGLRSKGHISVYGWRLIAGNQRDIRVTFDQKAS